MSVAEVNPFSDESILASVRQKLKGGCYHKSHCLSSGDKSEQQQSEGTSIGKQVDIRRYFGKNQKQATVADLKNVVRNDLKLPPAVIPDSALQKLANYLTPNQSNNQIAFGNYTSVQGSRSFWVDELQKFVQYGNPYVSNKGRVDRAMKKKFEERAVRKFQVTVWEKLGSVLLKQQQQRQLVLGIGMGGGGGGPGVSWLGASQASNSLLQESSQGVGGGFLDNSRDQTSGFGEDSSSSQQQQQLLDYRQEFMKMLQQYAQDGSISLSLGFGLDQSQQSYSQSFQSQSQSGLGVVGMSEFKTVLRSHLKCSACWDFSDTDISLIHEYLYGQGGVFGGIGNACDSSPVDDFNQNQHSLTSTQQSSGLGLGLSKSRSQSSGLGHGVGNSKSSYGRSTRSTFGGQGTRGRGGFGGTSASNNSTFTSFNNSNKNQDSNSNKQTKPKNNPNYENQTFNISDILFLLSLPKQTGLEIEFPNFTRPVSQSRTRASSQTFLLPSVPGPDDGHGTPSEDRLQKKFQKWRARRQNYSSCFNSGGHSCPPVTRFHSDLVNHERWSKNHNRLGYRNK